MRGTGLPGTWGASLPSVLTQSPSSSTDFVPIPGSSTPTPLILALPLHPSLWGLA